MEIDAALTLFSFAGFAALFVSWILAPLRAEGPTTMPVTEMPVAEGVQPRPAIAA